MKINFKSFKKTLAKSILADFVASFAVLSCPFCCFAMNVDGSGEPTIFDCDINHILCCKSEAERGDALYQLLNEKPFESEKDKEEYREKLINAVEAACKKEDKGENGQPSKATRNNSPLKPKELAEIENYQNRFMWDPSSC